METQKTETSISVLKRQSEAVGFRNCLRPVHLKQLSLLCTAYEDLGSVTFLQAVKHAVGRDFALLPCFASVEKAKAMVNVIFSETKSRTELVIDDFASEPITNSFALARALLVFGVLSRVLHNLPESYFTDLKIPVPHMPDRDFLAVLLQPLVDTLQLPPVVPESGIGLAAIKFGLHSAEFSFQHWVVSEVLRSVSMVVNNPAGEASGWDRQTLIVKLAPSCALPANWKDTYDTWSLRKRPVFAIPTTPLTRPRAGFEAKPLTNPTKQFK